MKISATEAQVLLLPTQIRDEALKRFHVSLVLDYHHHLVTRQNDYGLPDSVRCKVDTIMFCMKGCWDEDDLLKPDRSSNLQHFVVFGTLSKFFSYANWKDKHLHAPASEQDEARWKAMLAETWLGLCDKGLIRSGAVRYRRELLKHGVIRPLLQYDDGLVKIYISMKAVETDSNSNPIASMIGLGNAESLPDMVSLLYRIPS